MCLPRDWLGEVWSGRHYLASWFNSSVLVLRKIYRAFLAWLHILQSPYNAYESSALKAPLSLFFSSKQGKVDEKIQKGIMGEQWIWGERRGREGRLQSDGLHERRIQKNVKTKKIKNHTSLQNTKWVSNWGPNLQGCKSPFGKKSEYLHSTRYQ